MPEEEEKEKAAVEEGVEKAAEVEPEVPKEPEKKVKPREKREKVVSRKYTHYEIKDNKIVRKLSFCPRCGDGVFMGEHSDRYACGSCGYTTWKEK
jgi:small subunit ribosomal protein S27Ae